MPRRAVFCRPHFRLVCALVALLVVVCATTVARAQPVGQLEVKVFNIGQGDAILVTCPDGDHHLLIDSGDTRYPDSAKNFKAAMDAMFAAGQRHLTTVVASHPHQDHIGSMEWVLTNFDIDNYVDSGNPGDTATFNRVNKLRLDHIQHKHMHYVNGKENSGNTVPFCPKVTLHTLEPWAVDSDLSDPNDRSVAVRLDYQSKSFLFVGDIEGPAEDAMLNQFSAAERALLDVDVLKVGHHGSDTSSSAALLNAVTPDVALISCGEKEVGTNDRYKHPRLSTLRRFDDRFKNNPENGKVWAYDADKKQWRQETRHKGLWLTVVDGTITVACDGHNVQVKTEK